VRTCIIIKVAIVGAGIAGLSCAYEFEKHGITPTIFEKKKRIGEDVDYLTCTLKVFDRIYKDPLKYFKDEFDIELKPFNILRTIAMNAPTKDTIIESTSGYIFCRGDCKDSLENQLASYVKSPITFEKNVYVADIKDDYDYVIDATGRVDLPKQMGLFTSQLDAFTRIAVISGHRDFQVDKITMWVNTEYAKNCFCYLLPHSSNKACLVLTVNDITHTELDYYWEKLLTIENIKNTIIKTSDVKHEIGIVKPHKVDTIYFVGKAGGFIDPILGFGMICAIETGAAAARSIIHNMNYEKLVYPTFKYYLKNYEYRKILNTFYNRDFNIMVEALGLPIVKQLIYKNPLAKLNQGYFSIRALPVIQRFQWEIELPLKKLSGTRRL
jgi:digeranylgeranylglycerophospholipid reductase